MQIALLWLLVFSHATLGIFLDLLVRVAECGQIFDHNKLMNHSQRIWIDAVTISE